MALNPFVSAVGFALPELISSATIVSIVLSLPMTGPLFLRALQSQDMYLAGAFVLMIGDADDHRHADLGHPAGLARPADQVR